MGEAALKPGVYGKLPAHGDFVMRNLPSVFINAWDAWLQQFVGGSREQLGEEWLATYLTSPMWRFVLSPGAVDGNAWAGVVMPSVDRVGRYYPFSVVVRLPRESVPLQFIAAQGAWFRTTEEHALAALNGDCTIDGLMERLVAPDPGPGSEYRRREGGAEGEGLHVALAYEEQVPAAAYACMLDFSLAKAYSSYSAWSTTGSERVEPCLLTCRGLPSVRYLAAMMDGRWQHWGCSQPYGLHKTPSPDMTVEVT